MKHRLAFAFATPEWRFLILVLGLAAVVGIARTTTRPGFPLSEPIEWGEPNQPIGDWHIDEDVHIKAAMIPIAEVIDACERYENCDYNGRLFNEGLTYRLYQKAVLNSLPSGLPDQAVIVAARLANVGLHLVTIWLTWLTAHYIWPDNKRLWALSAVVMAFTPSISDLFSGINVESGVLLAGALMLYTGIRLAYRKLDWITLLCVLLLYPAYWVRFETTRFFLVPVLLGIWLAFSVRWRVVLAVAGVLFVGYFVNRIQPLSEQGAAYWFYQDLYTTQSPGNPLFPYQADDAKFGTSAIRFPHEDSYNPIVQYLPDGEAAQLSGQVVTYGGWYKTATPWDQAQPALLVNKETLSGEMSDFVTDGTWQHFSTTVTLPESVTTLAYLVPIPENELEQIDEFLIDGMYLLAGDYPAAPSDMSADGNTLTIGNTDHTNFLRNGSHEAIWYQNADNLRNYGLNADLGSIYYWERTWQAWARTPLTLHNNFWGSFNSIHPGLNSWQLLPYLLLSLLSLAGNVWVFKHYRPTKAYWLALSAAGTTLAIVFYRILIVPHDAVILQWIGMRHGAGGFAGLVIMIALGLAAWKPVSWKFIYGLLAVMVLTNFYILFAVQIPLATCTTDLLDCLRSVP